MNKRQVVPEPRLVWSNDADARLLPVAAEMKSSELTLPPRGDLRMRTLGTTSTRRSCLDSRSSRCSTCITPNRCCRCTTDCPSSATCRRKSVARARRCRSEPPWRPESPPRALCPQTAAVHRSPAVDGSEGPRRLPATQAPMREATQATSTVVISRDLTRSRKCCDEVGWAAERAGHRAHPSRLGQVTAAADLEL